MSRLEENRDPALMTMAISTGTHPDLEFEEEEKHGKNFRTFRCLIADLCQQFGGGHPGGPVSTAAIGIALYKYVVVYSPLNPKYPNRDRLVLSNGHTCLWQYVFMHWTGLPAMTFDQPKSYHYTRQDSICPGHPQIQHDSVESTSGPLGQGVANAVGLAVAAKHLGAT